MTVTVITEVYLIAKGEASCSSGSNGYLGTSADLCPKGASNILVGKGTHKSFNGLLSGMSGTANRVRQSCLLWFLLLWQFR